MNETYLGCGSSAHVERVSADARKAASGLYRNTPEPVVPIGVARNGYRLTAIVVVFGGGYGVFEWPKASLLSLGLVFCADEVRG
jgi:hypothetical protein